MKQCQVCEVEGIEEMVKVKEGELHLLRCKNCLTLFCFTWKNGRIVGWERPEDWDEEVKNCYDRLDKHYEILVEKGIERWEDLELRRRNELKKCSLF